MSQPPRRAIHEAEHGDLRPQFNPNAPVVVQALPEDLPALEAILLDRFFALSRPIADASAGLRPDLRLSDAGHFFYLIEALHRFRYPRLNETLLIILDEFLNLVERSYDELYLWCLVQLSRTDRQYAQSFWPEVFSLDLRYRNRPWQRPAGVRVYEQPYRFTDLLFYYYVLYSKQFQRIGDLRWDPVQGWQRHKERPASPSLGSLLKGMQPALSAGQLHVIEQALRELAEEDTRRPTYGDALGLLFGGRR
jgi:hypothetical protein